MGKIADLVKNGELSIEEIGMANTEKIFRQMKDAKKLMKAWKKVFEFPLEEKEIFVLYKRVLYSEFEFYMNKNGVLRIHCRADYYSPYNREEIEYNLNTLKGCFDLLDDEDKVIRNFGRSIIKGKIK